MIVDVNTENAVTLKDLEKIFMHGSARPFISELLKRYDHMLMKEREKSKYHRGS